MRKPARASNGRKPDKSTEGTKTGDVSIEKEKYRQGGGEGRGTHKMINVTKVSGPAGKTAKTRPTKEN